ncbi:MAG: hypothetical protein P1U64_09820 [Alcanivoracaceae bacterium]|nr:hypothetical protein [Alcanivoracaceae bacterium]
MRTTKKLLALSLAAAILPGCGGGDKDGRSVLETTPSNNTVSAKAYFDPAGGADFLPFPNDLLFSGSADATINIPGKLNSDTDATPPAAALADPQTALNTMDGFSTTAPMVVRFSGDVAAPVDVVGGDGVPDGVSVVRTDGFDPSALTLGLDRPLAYGVEYVAGPNGSSMLVIPTAPLQPQTTHVVAITSDLQTSTGEAVTADDTYALLNGAFLFNAAVGPLPATDFLFESDGTTPCDFNSGASLADCASAGVVNTAYSAAPFYPTLQGLGATDLPTLLQLEQLRRSVFAQSTILANAGLDISKVVLSYTVSTQDVGTALAQAADIADDTLPTFEVLNPVSIWDGPGGLPVEVTSPGPDGDLATPDYGAHIYLANLNGLTQFVDPANQNTTVWEAAGGVNLGQFNAYTPEAKADADHSIPVMISAPRAESLAGAMGFTDCSAGSPLLAATGDELPLVIFQHGITTSRATLLAVADALASICAVGVAIDLPKHGILPANDPFGASQIAQLQQALQQPPFVGAPNPTPVIERLVKVASPMDQCQAGSGTAALPDDGNFFCPSGDNFINLANLANARDTLRQGVVDLHSLLASLLDDDSALEAAIGGAAIDNSTAHFVGVSLGGVVGTPFVALDGASLATAQLNVTSGGIAKLLDGSASFEPVITSGLYSAGGIAKPSGDYEGFLIIAQSMIDNTDPINVTGDIVGNGTPILMQEVTGNGDTSTCILDGDNCPDQTVPNNVFGSSFGPAWGAIDEIVVGLVSPNVVGYQSSFLPGQNFLTTPVALAGTDPLAQGTAFLPMASAVQANPGLAPSIFATGQEDANGVVPGVITGGLPAFTGLGLAEVGSCGASGAPASGVVRFSAGGHGSLLSPAADPVTTLVMQTQMAGYIASQGTVIAGTESSAPFTSAEAGLVVRTQRGCP